MLDTVVFLVFVLALMAFFLSPAIYLVGKFKDNFNFVERYATHISLLLALVFSIIATLFIFKF